MRVAHMGTKWGEVDMDIELLSGAAEERAGQVKSQLTFP